MKEILEKIGLNDFFAYICSGAILLSSLTLWAKPDFEKSFLKIIIDQKVLGVIIVLISSYALGLILASYMARARYLCSARKEKRRGLLSKWWTAMIRFLYRFPPPRFTPSIFEANLRIAEDLEELSGVRELSFLASPWDWLVIYRVLKADQVEEERKSTLTEADNLHRKFLFSMGVALAIFLLSDSISHPLHSPRP